MTLYAAAPEVLNESDLPAVSDWIVVPVVEPMLAEPFRFKSRFPLAVEMLTLLPVLEEPAPRFTARLPAAPPSRVRAPAALIVPLLVTLPFDACKVIAPPAVVLMDCEFVIEELVIVIEPLEVKSRVLLIAPAPVVVKLLAPSTWNVPLPERTMFFPAVVVPKLIVPAVKVALVGFTPGPAIVRSPVEPSSTLIVPAGFAAVPKNAASASAIDGDVRLTTCPPKL